MQHEARTPSGWADWAHDKFHGDKLPLSEIAEAIARHVYEDCARRAERESVPESDDELTADEIELAERTPTLVGIRAAVKTTKETIAAGIRALARGDKESED